MFYRRKKQKKKRHHLKVPCIYRPAKVIQVSSRRHYFLIKLESMKLISLSLSEWFILLPILSAGR